MVSRYEGAVMWGEVGRIGAKNCVVNGTEVLSRESNGSLNWKAIGILLLLTAVWGLNHVAIRYSNQGVSPIFACTLRSLTASVCGVVYCWRKHKKVFHDDIMLFHGVMVGLLFGLEFVFLYVGLLYTHASRSSILMYLSPLVVAVGAHFIIKRDQLTLPKMVGLVLAFVGIVIVFQGRPIGATKTAMFVGDLFVIVAAFFWGVTTLYIKRFMVGKVPPINALLYQLIFSIPILFLLSVLVEPRWISRIDAGIVISLFYQSVVVAFISFLIWSVLIYGYAVSKLSAFTFLAPIFGVLFGILLLDEDFTWSLMVGLPLVCMGIFLVNGRKRLGGQT